MTCEWVGVLGFCLGPTQALIVLFAWTAVAAFLGRLVLGWLVSLLLRHAALSLGAGVLFVVAEFAVPGGIEGVLRWLITFVGMTP